jgi:hypothetical protein
MIRRCSGDRSVLCEVMIVKRNRLRWRRPGDPLQLELEAGRQQRTDASQMYRSFTAKFVWICTFLPCSCRKKLKNPGGALHVCAVCANSTRVMHTPF